MKLKNILIQKFMSKYQAIGSSTTEGLEQFILEQLEKMFKAEKFNEQDLVKVDRNIRNFIKSQK